MIWSELDSRFVGYGKKGAAELHANVNFVDTVPWHHHALVVLLHAGTVHA